MKKQWFMTWGLAIMIGTICATAQPPDEAMPGRGRQGARRTADGEQATEFIERWLERLRERDPEQYERLIELRETEPWAFRLALRRRWQETRIDQQLQAEHPDFYQYWQQLDPAEQQSIRELLARPVHSEREPRPARRGPLGRQLGQHAEARQLVAAWRATDDEAERAEVEARLRAWLNAQLETQIAEQEAEIAETEAALNRLRETLERRRAQQEVWINRLVDGLLQSGERIRERRGGPQVTDP